EGQVAGGIRAGRGHARGIAALPLGVRQRRLLLAVRHRAPAHPAGGAAGAGMAGRPAGAAAAEGQAGPEPGNTRFRLERAAAAGQPELPPLRRPEAHRRGLERGGRARVLAQAEDLVLSGDGMRQLPGLLRRGRGPRRSRTHAGAGPGGQHLPGAGLLDA
ncbi:MAG: PUTATIVE ZINC PROTEASE PROTEIN, partial [uncultured Ramlibacter sp.]